MKKTKNSNDLILENSKLIELNTKRAESVSLNVHQIRTGLTTTKWAIKMIIDGEIGGISKDQKEILGKVYESNERTLELAREILASNKSDGIDKEFKFEKVDLVGLIREVMAEFMPTAKAKKISISLDNQNAKINTVKADKEKLRIVLQNLFENAIKYNKEKGKIIASINPKGKIMEVSIKDTGIGINPINQKNIFKKYYRAPNAIKNSPRGTGLGLFACKKIIERHGGKIGFESKINEGTVFNFTIPLA
ncbi:MAG: GAF sensor signal transduction histidine kinase [Candidatus Nomurabacteria bacterium GW2011_GWB1_37_5]|uniref:histidine kinase n=1 Tax=Candidatus Nomurabacteria bacterium GW2011_GWB1_37_5 TaxID=1618742 RepID=A0A0G0K5U3_9BACT|nr:MAG: GAF sensor signal transduction histidine kinase [Candidatus Nomurabacteria bacterium GW2011_GWB1_37_5]